MTLDSTLVDGQISELSKRVDATHGLVRDLDSRFEAHRAHMDDRLDKLVDGMQSLVAAVARSEGADAAVDKKTKHGLQLRANLISAASVIAVVLSAFATIFSAVSVH